MYERLQADRRMRPTPFWSRHVLLGGRRVARRRDEDPEHFYVDQLGIVFGTTLVILFFFHVLDATFTLEHIKNGGSELNPLMGALIERGTAHFLWVKLGIAAVGIFLLGRHKLFPHVKPAVCLLFSVYAFLTVYHLFLLAGRS